MRRKTLSLTRLSFQWVTQIPGACLVTHRTESTTNPQLITACANAVPQTQGQGPYCGCRGQRRLPLEMTPGLRDGTENRKEVCALEQSELLVSSANSLHPLSPSPPCAPRIPPSSAFQLGSASGDHQQETRVVGRQGSQLGHILLQPVLMSHRGQLQLLCGLSYFL